MQRRLTLCAAPAVLAVLSAPAFAQEPPQFEPTPCPLTLPYEGEVEGETYECGVVAVPEDRDVPDGRTVELALLRLKATTLSPAPDPMIYLSGGPGSSAIHEISSLPALWTNMQPIRQRRDVIFYDQRGTGHSQVYSCGAFGVALGVIGEIYPDQIDLSDLEAEAATDEGAILQFAACAAGYTSVGVNLQRYNSVASAYDIADVAAALGYEEYNLYGTSYGAALALNAMRSAPDHIRSVVLDGVTSPGTPGTAYTTAKVQYHYDAIFEQCAADDFCNATWPDARARFIAVLEDLAEEPLRFDPPLVPSDFVRSGFGSTIDEIGPEFFAPLAKINNGALQGGFAGLVPMMVEALETRDTETMRDIIGRGTLPEIQLADTPPPPEDHIFTEDSFFENPIALLESAAAAFEAADSLDISDEWVRIAILDIVDRLRAGDEPQAEVMKALVELALVPLDGPVPEALSDYADEALSPEAAEEAGALAADMTRQEIRATFWSIQDLTTGLDGGADLALSTGTLMLLNCQEDINFTPLSVAEDYIAANPYPGVLMQDLDVYRIMQGICAVYPTDFERDEMMAHVQSDIPAMIFAEALDTQTPLPLARIVEENLSNDWFLEWESEGHVIAGHATDGCAGAIAAAFYDTPAREPDTTCAEAYRLPFEQLAQLIAQKAAERAAEN